MITIEAYDYTFTIDGVGKLRSKDADKATLRTLQAGAEEGRWNSPWPEPFATMETLQRLYPVTVVEAPAMVGQTGGEVIY